MTVYVPHIAIRNVEENDIVSLIVGVYDDCQTAMVALLVSLAEHDLIAIHNHDGTTTRMDRGLIGWFVNSGSFSLTTFIQSWQTGGLHTEWNYGFETQRIQTNRPLGHINVSRVDNSAMLLAQRPESLPLERAT